MFCKYKNLLQTIKFDGSNGGEILEMLKDICAVFIHKDLDTNKVCLGLIMNPHKDKTPTRENIRVCQLGDYIVRTPDNLVYIMNESTFLNRFGFE